MILLVFGSLRGRDKIISAQLDSTQIMTSAFTGREMSRHAILTPGVRTLTPIFNLYATVTLVGGAICSAWIIFKNRV